MASDRTDPWISQIRKGLVETCVLAVLAREEAYGYAILKRLAGIEGLELTESTVYPILGRLADEGLIQARTQPSPQGPPRRYYRLTADGRRRLSRMAASWRSLAAAVSGLLDGRGMD